jgi:DNA-binding NarL/FixJ family response regulator
MAGAVIKIIALDDQPAVLESLDRFFGLFEDILYLGGVSDPSALFALVARHTPDIVLLDNIATPPTDQIIRHLLAVSPTVRPVLFSASVDGLAVDRALDAGAWGCITKLTDPAETLELIRVVHAGGLGLCEEAYSLLAAVRGGPAGPPPP